MITASVAVEEVLLILKIAFLVLLYLFIWRIVRSAARDLRLPQESMILSPQQASALLPQPVARELGRLVVLKSPILDQGDVVTLDSSRAAAASREATSPACGPPIPSATAKSGGCTT